MLTKLVAGLRSSFRTHDARNALMELNDATLRDIGLTRAEIMNLPMRSEPMQTKPVFDRAPLLAGFAAQPTAQAA